MMGYGYGHSWILMLVSGLIVIGIITLIIYALMHAANISSRSSSSAPLEMQLVGSSRALAILAERYAKDEISDEEYKQKKIEITKL